MGMDPKRYLAQPRKRLTGSILGHCEGAAWYDELTSDEREALRQKVLDSIATYHDAVLDVIKALDGESEGVTNQAVWEFLQVIHRDLRSQRALPAQPAQEVAGGRTG